MRATFTRRDCIRRVPDSFFAGSMNVACWCCCPSNSDLVCLTKSRNIPERESRIKRNVFFVQMYIIHHNILVSSESSQADVISRPGDGPIGYC